MVSKTLEIDFFTFKDGNILWRYGLIFLVISTSLYVCLIEKSSIGNNYFMMQCGAKLKHIITFRSTEVPIENIVFLTFSSKNNGYEVI